MQFKSATFEATLGLEDPPVDAALAWRSIQRVSPTS
jgi:hypothetical protein